MHGTIVVAYDGSDHAEDALALARLMRQGSHCLLVLTCVVSSEHKRPEGEAALARARSELGDPPYCAYELVIGVEPAAGLHRVATREQAAAIAIGSSHRGAIERTLLGSVSLETLRHAPCSVAVPPAGYREHPHEIRTIGVAYDGGEESRQALRVAVDLARTLGSEVVVAGVLDLPRSAARVPAGDLESVPAVRSSLQTDLDEALQRVPEDVHGRTELLEGRVAVKLREASTELDLLVMGSRSLGPFDRVLLGSVSEGVVAGAGCPVLIVPRAAGAS
jgi:nucleotide-binding universal stress UspA family protein